MSTINDHWHRWITASIAKHFLAKRQSVYMHIEGFERKTDSLSEWFECRVEGPSIIEHSEGEFEVNCGVNVLIVVNRSENQNAYRPSQLCGIAAAGFTVHIDVLKLGPSSDGANDGSLIGCLTLAPGDGERIITSYFGLINAETKLVQASVEAHYRMFLSL